MADAREIGEYVATAAGLGLECSGFAPSWVVLQTILFTISATLAIFDTYTDWEVVFNFREDGFNNPLLPRSDAWLITWFLFAAIGSVLTVVSVVHDGIDVFYSIFKSCQKQVGKCSTKHNAATINQIQLKGRQTDSNTNVEEKNSKDEDKKLTKEEDEIPDPLKWCFRHGWNSTTRNETLGAITLWFQDVPMLTLAVLYGFSQSTCKTPDPRDVTPALLDIGISATVAVVASTWRVTRSFIRLYFTIKVAGKIEQIKCLKKCLPEPKPIKPPGKYLKKILPKSSESAYPPGTCAHKCLRAFYFGALMQIGAIAGAVGIIITIWANYGTLKSGVNFDDSLGIYRFSLTGPDALLFNISGTIIPQNGSFVNLEQIPYEQQYYNELGLRFDIYCLSEFEYREKEFEIFFNAAELRVVTHDGQFCAINTEQNSENQCYNFYLFNNFVLYYASRDPSTGDMERFDQTCSAVKDILGYRGGPKTDLNIDVGRLINRDGFPQNNEPLVIYYPEYDVYLLFSTLKIISGVSFVPFQLSEQTVLNCTAKYYYNFARGAIVYNYRGVLIDQQGCICASVVDQACAALHHRNVTYGYLTEDSRVVPYTHCSSLPSDKVVPQWDGSLPMACPYPCLEIE